MPEFAPRARENLDKSTHPDLQRAADGSLELKPDVDLPPGEREFRRMWSDAAQYAAFMRRLTHEQAQLPVEVQRTVAGQQFDGYGSTPDPYAGYLQYRSTINDLRSSYPGEVTGADVERMTLDEYDSYFDANGRPKPGVTYNPGGRDVNVSDRSGIDPFSSQEFRSNRS